MKKNIHLEDDIPPVAINEIQMVLAEKRTSLSVTRTGIAILVIPLSIMSFLIATSKHYDIIHVLHIFIPIVLINTMLICIGTYMVIKSIKNIRAQDHLIQKLKKHNPSLASLIT